jgi:hypothetical protein
MNRRFAVMAALITTGVGPLVSSAAGADDKSVKPPAAPRVQAQKVPAAKPPAGRAAGRAAPPQPDNHPGEQMLDRLLQMSPEQRQKALDRLNLPPQRRQNIEKRINEIQKLPPAMQNLARTRLEMLNSLPQPRQNQVRRSINQYAGALPERKAQMNEALQRIANLPDEDRRAYMNTEEFRNRFSPTEQQIISNLSEITPENRPRN